MYQVITKEVALQGLSVTAEIRLPGFKPQSHSQAPWSKYNPEANHSQPFRLLPRRYRETGTERYTKVLITELCRFQARRQPAST